MQTRDRVLRVTLWATVVANALGAFVFGSVALGRPTALLPVALPPFYAAQIGFVIALFGGVYAWLARQDRPNRPLVVVGGLGKLGFFGLTLAYHLAGHLPSGMVVQASPDLIFASVFLGWAWAAD